MSYGLQVFTGTGLVKLDSSSKAIRLIRTIYMPQNSSGSESVPEFTHSKGRILVATGSNRSYNFSWSWDESNKTISWDDDDYGGPGWALFLHTE